VPEELVGKPRQVEVLTAQGKTIAEAIGVAEPTCHRWRSEYGGLKLEQVKRLKQLEAENARLRKAVADLATATAGSRRCCGWQAAAPTISMWSGSGGRRAEGAAAAAEAWPPLAE
jgi:hypothetical protein